MAWMVRESPQCLRGREAMLKPGKVAAMPRLSKRGWKADASREILAAHVSRSPAHGSARAAHAARTR